MWNTKKNIKQLILNGIYMLSSNQNSRKPLEIERPATTIICPFCVYVQRCLSSVSLQPVTLMRASSAFEST